MMCKFKIKFPIYYAPQPFTRKKVEVQKTVYAEDLEDAIIIAVTSTTLEARKKKAST